MLKLIKKLLERNAFVLAVLLSLFIAFVSLVSLKGVVQVKIDNSDKYGHFIAYTLLGLSWFYALRNNSIKKVLIIIFLVVYGIVLEGLQELLTLHRQADIYDVLANTTGILIAAFLWGSIAKKF